MRAVGEDMTQPQNGKVWRWRMEVSTPEGAVVILDVGDVKAPGGGQQAAGDDATLAALGLLVCVKDPVDRRFPWS